MPDLLTQNILDCDTTKDSSGKAFQTIIDFFMDVSAHIPDTLWDKSFWSMNRQVLKNPSFLKSTDISTRRKAGSSTNAKKNCQKKGFQKSFFLHQLVVQLISSSDEMPSPLYYSRLANLNIATSWVRKPWMTYVRALYTMALDNTHGNESKKKLKVARVWRYTKRHSREPSSINRWMIENV